MKIKLHNSSSGIHKSKMSYPIYNKSKRYVTRLGETIIEARFTPDRDLWVSWGYHLEIYFNNTGMLIATGEYGSKLRTDIGFEEEGVR